MTGNELQNLEMDDSSLEPNDNLIKIHEVDIGKSQLN